MAPNQGVRPGGPGEVSPQQVQDHCARVLASPAFEQAPTLGRLLRYLVDQSLKGNTDSLKEFAIGLEVFGRGPSFDPRLDTIVRAHARRLRHRLAAYYESDGRNSPVILDLPKGHYVIQARAATDADLARTGPSTDSIVVLPFASASGDSADEYFADGLTEEIIHALAGLSGLHVVSRTSAFQFKNHQRDIREIGRLLGVGVALEGSVRRDGATVRVSVRLIDVRDGFQIWSSTSDRELTNVFRVQDELSRAIAGQLGARLGSVAGQVRTSTATNADAHDHYLKGRHLWNKADPESVAKALKHFRAAVTVDPEYAAAHAAIADAYVYLATLAAESPAPLLNEARRSAQRALALQDVADAHSALGAVLAIADRAWDDAEHEFTQALRLSPSSSHVRGAYAILCLAPQRRIEEAIDQLRHAVRVDPLSAFQRSMLAQTLILAGRPDDALDEIAHALDLDPDHMAARLTEAWALIGKGEYSAAVAVLHAMPAPCRELPNHGGHLGHALARVGRRSDAGAVLHELLERFQGPWVPAVDIAAIHCGLGAREDTLSWLERGYALGAFDVVFAGDDPRFADVRGDARLQALLAHRPGSS
jgi:TolB-like protein/Tfp pilus assembly protein PilF